MRTAPSNALEYRREDQPRVVVTSERDAHGYPFRVRDNGIGIDAKDLARLFEPFHRLHVDGEVTGTDLGMSLGRAIAEDHQGRIWAESKVGVGTTVLFVIAAN